LTLATTYGFAVTTPVVEAKNACSSVHELRHCIWRDHRTENNLHVNVIENATRTNIIDACRYGCSEQQTAIAASSRHRY
jgi:hypothetical protein